MSWNWYDESEIDMWADQEEQAFKKVMGALLRARQQAQTEEENNA